MWSPTNIVIQTDQVFYYSISDGFNEKNGTGNKSHMLLELASSVHALIAAYEQVKLILTQFVSLSLQLKHISWQLVFSNFFVWILISRQQEKETNRIWAYYKETLSSRVISMESQYIVSWDVQQSIFASHVLAMIGDLLSHTLIGVIFSSSSFATRRCVFPI